MSEDHIKTVVIDLPVEKYAQDEARDEAPPDHSENYESNSNGEYNPAMPSSWLS